MNRNVDRKWKEDIPNFFFVCAKILIPAGIALTILCSFNGYIWADEAYSLRLVQYSYKEILLMCAGDVHPPLYYIALKLIQDIGALIFDGFYATVVIGKLFSIVPYILLVEMIRRKLSDAKGMLPFIMLFVYGAPQLIAYAVEIRMYGWAMFFVTASFLYARDVVIDDKNKKSWLLLVVFSVLGAYTHTFALVAMASIWFVLFVWILVRKKSMLQWLKFSAAVGVLFLPWLLVLVNQLKYAKESYWIQPITWTNVLEYVMYAFGGALLCVPIMVLVGLYTDRKKTKENKFADGFGVLVPVLTVSAGIFVSLAVRPVFADRYMVPGLMCMWISILLISAKFNRGIKMLITECILIYAMFTFVSFARSEVREAMQAKENISFVEALDENAVVIVSCDTHVSDVLAAYTPNMIYNWRGPELNVQTVKYREAFTNEAVFDDMTRIEEWLNEDIPLYYIEVDAVDERLWLPAETDTWGREYVGECSFEWDGKIYRIVAKE